MCTVMTVSAAVFYASKKSEDDFRDRIWRDSLSNRDGQSVIIISDGEVIAQLRSMDANLILGLIDSSDWDRIFIHSRLATQGEVSLANTHGWHTNGIYYMHNGFISASEANLYEVDSQAIGHWLRRGGVTNALTKLRSENYANVLMVDTQEWAYYMHRSRSGSLYTDGNGNYSTNSVGPIDKRVQDCTQELFLLPPARPKQKQTGTTTASTNTTTTQEAKPLSAVAGEATTSATSEATKPEVSPNSEVNEYAPFGLYD